MPHVTIVWELATGGMGMAPAGRVARGVGAAGAAWATEAAGATGAAGATEVADAVVTAGAPGEDAVVGVGEEGAPTPVAGEPIGEGDHWGRAARAGAAGARGPALRAVGMPAGGEGA